MVLRALRSPSFLRRVVIDVNCLGTRPGFASSEKLLSSVSLMRLRFHEIFLADEVSVHCRVH